MIGTGATTRPRSVTRRSMLQDIRRNPFSYALLLPAVIYVFLFSYMEYPYMLIAFQKYSFKTGLFGSEFVGLKNFEFFFRSPRSFMVTRNTLLLNALFIALETLFAVGFAVLFSLMRKNRYAKTAQSMFIFPNFISWVIVGYMLYALLSSDYGLINQTLRSLGFDPVNWYAQARYWPAILALARVWKNTGMNMVIYLAAITGFDPALYESAEMDGANRLRQTMSITLPLLMPTVCILTLMSIGKIFYGDFGMIYALIRDNGTLYQTTDVIDTYVFRALRKTGNPSQAMAIGLYQSVLGFLMVFGSNWLAKRYFHEGALF